MPAAGSWAPARWPMPNEAAGLRFVGPKANPMVRESAGRARSTMRPRADRRNKPRLEDVVGVFHHDRAQLLLSTARTGMAMIVSVGSEIFQNQRLLALVGECRGQLGRDGPVEKRFGGRKRSGSVEM